MFNSTGHVVVISGGDAGIGFAMALEEFEDAFALLIRSTPGRDSIRVALRPA